MKIDRRKKYYMILDTETTADCLPEENTGKNVMVKYIYNLGYTIASKNEIIIKRDYLVKEIWEDDILMNNAYFKSKCPEYQALLHLGRIEIKPLADIVKILQEDIQATGVSTFGAYNVSFDLDALMQTVNFIYPDTFKMIYRQTNSGKYAPDTTKFCQKYIFRKNLEIIDIWTMACQTLCNQKTFQTYYLEETARGNIKSNAEIVYNYIEDLGGHFKEDHTALSDSIIETAILQRILKLHKKLQTKFTFMPFRLIERVV